MVKVLIVIAVLTVLCVTNRIASKTYVFKVLLYLDMFVSALIWRNPDITISSQTGLALQTLAPPKWATVLGWVLDKLQPNHCQLAIADDLTRAQAAVATLSKTGSLQ